ncbi:MAG: DUF4422 domain-containing protein [Elusimicrobiaceae bacterium]|nr:DUF4422 domain-containing protein [Elusimicrobiaceae bacterium]
MNSPKVKILVAHHDQRCPAINSEVLCPVQTGSALAPDLFPDMLHDNSGENISKQNLKYNELTALYWAWKNQDKLGNPDFIGLMHDRRHFLFNPALPIPNKDVTWLPQSPVYMFPPICERYLTYLTDDIIRSYFTQYDCMVLKPYNSLPRIGQGNMRDCFLHSEEMTYEIFDVWAATVKNLFPDYLTELEQFSNGTYGYLCNMSVMRKDLFDQYCHFLFSVLQSVDAQIDSTGFSVAKKRFLGYLGEFTLSLFMMKLKKQKDVRVIEMNGLFFMPQDCKEYHKLAKYKWGKTFLWGKWRQKYQRKYDILSSKLAVLHFFK